MTFQHAFGQFTQATKCGLAQPIPAKWDKKKSPIGTSQQILWITHTQAVSIDGETLPKPVANPRSGLSFCGWGNPAWETYGKLIGAWIDQRWRTLSPDWWKLMAWRSKKILENQGSQQSQHVTTLPCSVVQRAVTSQGWPVLASRDQSDWRRELKDLKLIGSEHRMCSPGRHPFSRYLAESCRRLWEDFQVSAPSTAYLHLCRSPAMGQCGGCDTARGCESGLAPTWESCD